MLSREGYQTTYWKDIRVGNIVKIKNNDFIPVRRFERLVWKFIEGFLGGCCINFNERTQWFMLD